MLIGLSLSFCIADVARGRVRLDDVAFLTTGTRAVTPEDWEGVLASYRDTYWSDFPERATTAARRLFAEGRILQPRVEDQDPYGHSGAVEYDGRRLGPHWITREQLDAIAAARRA